MPGLSKPARKVHDVPNMPTKIISKSDVESTAADTTVLRFAYAQELLARLLLDWSPPKSSRNAAETGLIVPDDWPDVSCWKDLRVERYNGSVPLSYGTRATSRHDAWLEVLNKRFVTQVDDTLLQMVLSRAPGDLITITVDPGLRAGCEKVRLTSRGTIAGFRRLYTDVVEPAPLPDDWPHRLFIRGKLTEHFRAGHAPKRNFAAFLAFCKENGHELLPLKIGGLVFDLNTEQGLLDWLNEELPGRLGNRADAHSRRLARKGVRVGTGARLIGPVVLGRNVTIAEDAVVAGPAIISDNASIGARTILRNSIIGHDVSIPAESVVQHRVLAAEPFSQCAPRDKTLHPGSCVQARFAKNRLNGYRQWPKLSYPGCFKRIADIVTALVVLVLFAPVMPIVALVIKLTSPGPVFFRDRRQGLHGRSFNCLKFRTMMLGADGIQQKLRVLNAVDGPQFKMNDDPRTSPVGRFLRDTYLDEIPQFINVLLGQMSVVGPRPSPESENRLCPYWRDARLSVRPGITGLWQVCRTRRPGRDFQEWIYFDTKYVSDLSARLDLWICWRTALKMARNFFSQF